MSLRPETRSRARALQLLYAWELQGGGKLNAVLPGVSRLVRPGPVVLDRAAELAQEVVRGVGRLDGLAQAAADNWRLERIATVERNILRIGVLELERGEVSPKTAIDEAVTLAHWFGGARAPGFVNGVLDRVARTLGKL